jgi:death-on-curing protein
VTGGEEEAPLVYIDVELILHLYASLFGCSADQAADQLPSPAALEGALSRPMYHAHNAGADLALQAAVLCHGIAEIQPFIDGNKRTALAAMLTFLRANDVQLEASDAELAS